MPKDLEYYRELMHRYLRNECTPAEAEELLDYTGQSEANRLLLQTMQEQFHAAAQQPLPEGGSREAWAMRVKKNLLQQTQPVPRIRWHQHKLFRAAAAAVLVLALAGAWFLYFNQPTPVEGITGNTSTPMQDIPPGGNKAVLTLADGSRIVLDEAKDGNLAVQGNTRIIKLDDRISYQSGNNNNEVLINTISTPRGGQYILVLPDGSKVWLNAASSLKFPTAFTGKERNVSLTGEGYFEVAKNTSMPFHVNTANMKVEVLGTHFNINAYDDERAIQTTLLEGAVRVSSEGADAFLKPGQQAVFTKENKRMNVFPNADIDQAVAWKNGYFQFDRTPLEMVMRRLQRWYDVEIRYEGNVPQKTFWGKIPMNINAAEALKILETSGVHFHIDGKKIIIKP